MEHFFYFCILAKSDKFMQLKSQDCRLKRQQMVSCPLCNSLWILRHCVVSFIFIHPIETCSPQDTVVQSSPIWLLKSFCVSCINKNFLTSKCKYTVCCWCSYENTLNRVVGILIFITHYTDWQWKKCSSAKISFKTFGPLSVVVKRGVFCLWTATDRAAPSCHFRRRKLYSDSRFNFNLQHYISIRKSLLVTKSLLWGDVWS